MSGMRIVVPGLFRFHVTRVFTCRISRRMQGATIAAKSKRWLLDGDYLCPAVTLRCGIQSFPLIHQFSHLCESTQ